MSLTPSGKQAHQPDDLVEAEYGSTLRRKLAGRSHFSAICARLMRRILADYARSRSYLKRDGGLRGL